MSDERTHRVVPGLRHDEVVFLERLTRNNRPGVYFDGKLKCPHLKIFHNTGVNPDDGPWWACNICSASEHDDRVSWNQRKKAREAEDRAQDRLNMISLFMVGCAVTGVAWALSLAL